MEESMRLGKSRTMVVHVKQWLYAVGRCMMAFYSYIWNLSKAFLKENGRKWHSRNKNNTMANNNICVWLEYTPKTRFILKSIHSSQFIRLPMLCDDEHATLHTFFRFIFRESKCYNQNICNEKDSSETCVPSIRWMVAQRAREWKSFLVLEFYSVDEEWAVHMFNFCWSYNCLSLLFLKRTNFQCIILRSIKVSNKFLHVMGSMRSSGTIFSALVTQCYILHIEIENWQAPLHSRRKWMSQPLQPMREQSN